MPRRRRHEEHENLERWLISYADFITLLFAFFVVMYAISSVNEGKYRVLSDTLEAAFNNTPKSLQPIQVGEEGISGPPSPITQEGSTPDRPAPVAEAEPAPPEQDANLGKMADEFQGALQPMIDRDLIKMTRNDQWVEIEINTSLLFTSGSALLEDEALPVLNRLADILQRYPNAIQVEGFTDNVPIRNSILPSNWELSAARAASVVHLFMNGGVPPQRMAAIGYGEYRPIADNATAEGRNRNRRVLVIVKADVIERRDLQGGENRAPAERGE